MIYPCQNDPIRKLPSPCTSALYRIEVSGTIFASILSRSLMIARDYICLIW